MPAEFADLLDEKIELTLRTQEMQIFEYQLQLPEKGICNYEARMIPSDKDEITAIVRDITDRKKAEAEIKSKNEELLKLVTEKDKLFSIIAHDLRSPFSGFLGLTEIMVDDIEDISLEEMKELALAMRKSAKNVFKLLENLLEWARMEQGLIPFNPVRMNIPTLLNECILLLVESINRKKITIEQNVATDLVVVADRYMLEAILRNLISNAIKFTTNDGEIYISAVIKMDKCIEISVKDSGIGMNAEMVEHLFELSAKSGRKGTAGEPSTGLGLVICKEFVEKHQGRIWVESVVAMGSTFFFTIPFIPYGTILKNVE
jgi:signal transduction histidine kinase